MIRILALVEGQTEETFVREILAPDLMQFERDLRAILIGKPGSKGGIRRYDSVKSELLRLLKSDKTAFVTTMFDYYGLPRTFPGRTTAVPGISEATLRNVGCVADRAGKDDRRMSTLRVVG